MFERRYRNLMAAMVHAMAAAMILAPHLAAQSNSAKKPKTNPISTSGLPVESAHEHGPDGLEGWTLKSSIPDRPNERFPFTLVVARNGDVIRRISGDPFVWNWKFCPGGKQIAYETGPLHFSLQCNLEDISTGHMQWSADCFHGVPENAPECVKELETAY